MHEEAGGSRRRSAARAAGFLAAAAAAPAIGLLAAGAAPGGEDVMDAAAVSYVKLALAVGAHDPDYVDAYYGPPEWRQEAERARRPLSALRGEAAGLAGRLEGMDPSGDGMEALRRTFLIKQLRSMAARVEMLGGRRMGFDEESEALYDARAPRIDEARLEQVLARLEELLPGKGPVHQRYHDWRSGFAIPPARLDDVFKTAVAACRERTAARVALPEGESFIIEYVKDKPWSGYNWYQGGLRSLIQVNVSLPVFADRALDLACHEGYPGHHVYNMMLEHHLVKGRGWKEFTVYPLFSPQSLIAEGSANLGIEIAFPGSEREAFDREVVFPRAGLDPARVSEYARVQELSRELDHAVNEAARRYLDNAIDASQAAAWLTRYALMSPAAARQRVTFIDRYRTYVINYNLGRDLVRDHVARRAGPGATAAETWRVFAELLSSPRLPSDLR
ncbi:MAG TPA: hypothetical protein VJV23_05455 [Candidatus Polarisedimenticolia bacterium]|nr:hypothetical protein [Candidatus Polarisedimenticolia bacterium]